MATAKQPTKSKTVKPATKAVKAAKVARTTDQTAVKPAAKKPTSAPKAKAPVKSTRKVTKDTVNTGFRAKKRIRKPKVVSGFADFLREQSVVGLAIGLVLGTQIKALADQMIASFINPLIGLLLPGTGALDKKVFILHIGEKSAPFAWGSFVAVLLSFITTSVAIYFVFKALKLDKLSKKKD